MRDARLDRKHMGVPSQSGRQCDGMMSLRLSMCSDSHDNDPGSLALGSGCRDNTPDHLGLRLLLLCD